MAVSQVTGSVQKAGWFHRRFLRCSVTSLTFVRESGPMRIHKGRTAAAGLLCAVAATVAVWNGPLFAASSALHASSQAAAHTVSHGHTAR